jgi:hypothetical protein
MLDLPADQESEGFVVLAEDVAALPKAAPRALEVLPHPVVRTVDGTVGGTRRVMGTLYNTPQLGPQVASAAFSAVQDAFMKSNPFDVGTYMPHKYVATGLAAAAASFVGRAAKTTQGIDDVDNEAIITRAQEHLRRGWEGFSQDQRSVVEAWIDEARKGLKDYTSKHYKALDEVMRPGCREEAAADEGAPAPAKGKKSRSERRSTVPPLDPSAPPPQVTFETLIHGATQVAASMNPDRTTLAERAPKLATVLEALDKFSTLPCRIQKTTREEVDRNFEDNIAWGSENFINTLKSRAHILAENAFKKVKEQNKKVMIAISGPGTGKTTNIQKMAEWIKQPLCMLTGEQFCKMKMKEGQDAFAMFEEWLAIRLLDQLRVDGSGVINGLVLLDDFHFALEPGGPFSVDRYSRPKFFQFLKNLGDANQESVLSVELAPGRIIPLNLGRVQVILTLNRETRELGETGEPALLSRIFSLNPEYLTPADRKFIATKRFLPTINKAIVQRYGWTTPEDAADGLSRIDMGLAVESVLKVVAVDIDIAEKKFDGQMGFRALCDLLDQYKQHVLGKIGDVALPVPEDLYGLHGTPPFDPLKVAGNITDYKKGLDQNMARLDRVRFFQQKLAELRQSASTLPRMRGEILLTKLKDIETSSDDDDRKKVLAAVETRLAEYLDVVPLPDRAAFGRALVQQFGYLRSRGADGEADRFGAIKSVATELYFRMLAARHRSPRSEDDRCRDNRLIRVKFSDPAAEDPSVYGELAKILGGVPVHFLTEPHSFFAPTERVPSFAPMELACTTLRTSVASKTLSIRYKVREDYIDTMTNCTLQEVKIAERLYFYFRYEYAMDGRNYSNVVVTPAAVESLVKAAESGTVVDGTSSLYITLRGPKGFEDTLREHMTPRLCFIENYLSHARDGLSTGEALIIAKMHAGIRMQMNTWAAMQPTFQPDKSPRALFERHLHAQLNAEALTLQGGRVFDPRSLTLFLLDDTNDPAGNEAYAGNEDISLTLTLGIPPIEGRATRARFTLAQALSTVMRDAEMNLKLFGKDYLGKLALSQEEEAIFEELIVWDHQVAESARAAGYVLPTSVLDHCVTSLVQRVADRETDYFEIDADSQLPELSAFKSEWAEAYKEHVQAIERRVVWAAEQKAAEEEAKVFAERLKEAEKERLLRGRDEPSARKATRNAPDAGFTVALADFSDTDDDAAMAPPGRVARGRAALELPSGPGSGAGGSRAAWQKRDRG